MPKRPRVLNVLAVLAILLVAFLLPTRATARPLHTEQAARLAAERSEATPGVLAQLRGLLSVLWAETGSVLEPDGKITTGTNGDNGSGLDPNGRH